jgi:DNA (cytosine-5)-methyltransferase 1
MDGIHLSSNDYLLFIACAPCQPYSRILRKSTTATKTHLVLTFAEFVKELAPDIIFMENVPGLAEASQGRVLKEFLETLKSKKLNYECEWQLVDAKSYGVPQTRKRFILLASRIGKIPFPSKTHGDKLLPYVTVKDILSKYPRIKAGETHKDVPNHSARALSQLNLRRMRSTPRDGGSRKDWPQELWLECHKKNSGHTDVYGRMRWKKPAPTLTCKCNSITNGRFGHPTQNRPISLREAAALQTFSDDFVFYGENTYIARHIGNAVPVLIAEVFGKGIVAHVSSIS